MLKFEFSDLLDLFIEYDEFREDVESNANDSGGNVFKAGMRKRKRWKRFFFCGSRSRSAKILPLPLPHRLFDLKSSLAKSFVHFPMWIKR